MKLLVIRPQPGADATATRIKAAGHEPFVMPLFGVGPVEWDPPSADGYDAILLTSANAVRQAGPQLADLSHLPVLAVGTVTATAAREAGLHVSQSGTGGLEALLAATGGGKLLWLAGEDRTEITVPPHIRMDICTVYRSAALDVPADFRHRIDQADYILLHSARAASHFRSLVTEKNIDKAQISLGTLSENIAFAAGGGWQTVRVAPQPDDAALLSCL